MLTIERAIADNLDPQQLRWVADSNEREANKRGVPRMLRQAQNLRRVADRLELLGYGRGAGRKVAA